MSKQLGVPINRGVTDTLAIRAAVFAGPRAVTTRERPYSAACTALRRLMATGKLNHDRVQKLLGLSPYREKRAFYDQPRSALTHAQLCVLADAIGEPRPLVDQSGVPSGEAGAADLD